MPRTFRQRIVNAAAKLYFKFKKSALAQSVNASTVQGGEVDAEKAELLRRAAAEGAVLLKNDGTLPLKGKFALFGRVQRDTFCTGYGSGGDVVKPYAVSISEGLERAGAPIVRELSDFYRDWQARHPAPQGGWGDWSFSYPEADVPEELFERARRETDTAVVVIGRAAGEDRDSELRAGSYFLTEKERALLARVKEKFSHVAVVLNIGSLIDLSFAEEYSVGALLLIWQGGMEAGNACADLLLGHISPCGKLPDTVPMSYGDLPAQNFGGLNYNEYTEDIYVGYRHFETFAPDRVRYPFGFGLSYTKFHTEAEFSENAVRFRVKNVGGCAGREVVQVYLKKPCGEIGNPARELIGFYKTGLLPPLGEERGEIALKKRDFCSFDEVRSAYVLLAGDYAVYVGSDARSADMVGGFTVEREEIFLQLRQNAAPPVPFAVQGHSEKKLCRAAQADLKERILRELPSPLPCTGDRGILLSDVKAGSAKMKDFVAQLSDEELAALSRGALKMDSPLGARGNAGVMGGVTPSLRVRGVPAVTMTDGPSGIRLKAPSSLVPIATLLAATFDEALVGAVYGLMGREMAERGSHVLLAPALNLHRNPLCGRNFEYFSEDPFLAGKIASAAVKGIQAAGGSACPKHFACNGQEFNRSRNDSRLSERALRELYLKGFEICVTESAPRFLMTSYNKVNGVWAHYHYELVRGILRGEWGFQGCVVTDWWMKRAKSPHFKRVANNAYRVRAGVNVLMPGGDYLGKRVQGGNVLRGLGKSEGLIRAELQRNAEEVLQAVMHTSAMTEKS